MDNLDKVLDKPIAFHRCLIDIAGGVLGALWLSQAIYWARRSSDGWFCKSVEQWQEETGLGKEAQQTVREILKSKGILKERLAGMPQRLFFALNFDVLAREIQNNRTEKSQEPEPAQAQALPLEGIELPSPKKKTVPQEYAKLIIDAWQRIHKLQDGTDPLTKTDYAILQQTIKKLFQESIPIEDVLGTIEDIGELSKTSPVWASAKPPVLLNHISSYRAGILKRQIEFERSKNTARKGVSYEYNPEHDFRRRQV